MRELGVQLMSPGIGSRTPYRFACPGHAGWQPVRLAGHQRTSEIAMLALPQSCMGNLRFGDGYLAGHIQNVKYGDVAPAETWKNVWLGAACLSESYKNL